MVANVQEAISLLDEGQPITLPVPRPRPRCRSRASSRPARPEERSAGRGMPQVLLQEQQCLSVEPGKVHNGPAKLPVRKSKAMTWSSPTQ